MRHIDRNCSIKLLYSYLTNPYHRWYGKTHGIWILISATSPRPWASWEAAGGNGGNHGGAPWFPDSPHPYGPWLALPTHPSMFENRTTCTVLGSSGLHKMGARAPGHVQRIKELEDQRLGATQRFIAAERKRQTDFRFSGPLSHFVCQSLSRKIWPSRRFMGRKWEFLKIFGEYFKGMGTIDLPWFTLQDYFTGRTWRSLA